MDQAYLLAGLLQGLLEWLPVSSSGQVMLALSLSLGLSPGIAYELSLALHGGTLLSAIAYYWRSVVSGIVGLTRPMECEVSRIWLIATPVSVAVGYPLFLLYERIAGGVGLDWLMILVGAPLTLIGVAGLSLSGSEREELTLRDILWLAVAQGVAAIPGVSRSGLTIAVLVLRGVSPLKAVRSSFLAGIPVILLAAVYTGLVEGAYLASSMGVALASSFLSGLAGIYFMELLARRLNMHVFSLVVGLVLVASGLVALIL
ncbi:MAG: undecaprenyl-diphosphate phosphatase [Desulfurococcales archaeon]|nr:undecaprenyl-diphosphate phosphatase [Desulfurococcales archaeon]